MILILERNIIFQQTFHIYGNTLDNVFGFPYLLNLVKTVNEFDLIYQNTLFRYFVSFVIQFQFYEALCKKSGQYVETDPEKPLYLCDFSAGGKDTGDLIK